MIGQLFLDRYKIIEKLGSGGTAVVYRAVDTILNRDVTVKILQNQLAENQRFVMRFRKEARAVAQLSHPNIVSVYDVGVSEKGDHYLIMEYIEGVTLKNLINAKGPLSLELALDYVHQILAGLYHAHSYGVIHRDIKPQNVMITPAGQVKIMDFGLAMNMSETTITYDTSIFGSVYYIAPETAAKGNGDSRVDIYSTGVVLYEMLTKKLPYEGDAPVSIAMKHIEGDYISVDDIDSDIPYEVARIVDKAMCKDPANRYHDAKIMMQDIETAADEYDIPLTPITIEGAGSHIHSGYNKKSSYKNDSYDDDDDDYIPRKRRNRNRNHNKDYDDDSRSHSGKKKKKRVLPIILCLIAAFLIGGLGSCVVFNLISGDEEDGTVPNLIGLTEEQAIEQLIEAGYKYDIVQEESTQYDAGIVIAQSEDPGSEVSKGTRITITVSIGSGALEVPDVTNSTKEDAVTILESAGFKVVIEEEESDEIEEGLVIRQSPSAKSKLNKDESVTIYVSIGKQQIEVPNVVGLTEEDALDKLAAAGLTGKVTSREYNSSQSSGFVFYQNYSYGEKVDSGTVIRIKVSKGSSGGGGSDSGGGSSGGGSSGGGSGSGGNNDNPSDDEERD